MWVKFVVGSCPCFEGFSPGFYGSLQPTIRAGRKSKSWDKCLEMLNTERAYKKAPSSTLLASILKSRVRVTVVKEKSSANFAFLNASPVHLYRINKLICNINYQ